MSKDGGEELRTALRRLEQMIAQDLPVLQKPVGRVMLRLEDRWCDVKRWWNSGRAGARGCVPTDS